MNSCAIHVGDALTVLRTMETESVHCCVTSPPYWGLRDYGTAKWEGGDAACNHNGGGRKVGEFVGGTNGTTHAASEEASRAYKTICAKCGARRIDAQLGLERTPEEYVANIVQVFREVKRVLRPDGTLWLNLGDCYAANGLRGNNNGMGKSTMGWPGQRPETLNKASGMRLPAVEHGLKPKDLVGIPWRVAFALQEDGWYLRQDIIWHKPSPMPESVTDRCTKAHEYIFLLSKSAKYWYDAEAIKEDSVEAPRSREKHNGESAVDTKERGYDRNCGCDGTRNKRSVWTIASQPFKGAHFATFPTELVRPCVLAGCPPGGTVLDPFIGSGTTGLVAAKLGRNCIGIELNFKYAAMARKRINDACQLLVEVTECPADRP